MKGYRTLIFNALAAILPVLELLRENAVIPEQYMDEYVLLVLIGNGILRYLTDTPVGNKEPQKPDLP